MRNDDEESVEVCSDGKPSENSMVVLEKAAAGERGYRWGRRREAAPAASHAPCTRKYANHRQRHVFTGIYQWDGMVSRKPTMRSESELPTAHAR